MRKPVTDMEIVYEQVDVSPDDSQRRLNDMFDVLFEETLKYMKRNREKKLCSEEVEKKQLDQLSKHIGIFSS